MSETRTIYLGDLAPVGAVAGTDTTFWCDAAACTLGTDLKRITAAQLANFVLRNIDVPEFPPLVPASLLSSNGQRFGAVQLGLNLRLDGTFPNQILSATGGGDGGGGPISLHPGAGITLNPNPITDVGTIGLTVPVSLPLGGTGVAAVDPPMLLAQLGAAPLASPTFTGNVFAPRPDTGASDRVATTTWVEDQMGEAGLGTVTQITASAPLTGGVITTVGTIGLGTLGTAATYGYPAQIVTDAYGRISSISAGAAPLPLSGGVMTGAIIANPAVPNTVSLALGATTYGFARTANDIQLWYNNTALTAWSPASVMFATDIDMLTKGIHHLAEPLVADDAATKGYVDGASGGGGIPEPGTGGPFGRTTGNWVPVLPLIGGTLTGALTVRTNAAAGPPSSTPGSETVLKVQSLDGVGTSLQISSFANNTSYGPQLQFFYAEGVAGGPQFPPLSSRPLGQVQWFGWNGSSYVNSANIIGVATQPWTGGATPAYGTAMTFNTAANGESVPLLRLAIGPLGGIYAAGAGGGTGGDMGSGSVNGRLYVNGVAAATLTGDLGPGSEVVGLRGVSIATNVPTDNQVLRYNAGGNLWVPSTITGGGTPGSPNNSVQYNLAGSFGGATGLTVNSPGTAVVSLTMSRGGDATGDLYYRSAGGPMERLAVGTGTQVLGVTSGLPAWVEASSGGGGGVSSVTGGTGMVVGPNTGDVTVSLYTPVPIQYGGTNAETAAGARTALGISSIATRADPLLPAYGGTGLGGSMALGVVLTGGGAVNPMVLVAPGLAGGVLQSTGPTNTPSFSRDLTNLRSLIVNGADTAVPVTVLGDAGFSASIRYQTPTGNWVSGLNPLGSFIINEVIGGSPQHRLNIHAGGPAELSGPLTVSQNPGASPATEGLYVVGADGAIALANLDAYRAGIRPGLAPTLLLSSANGTAAVPAATQNNDVLGIIAATAFDGASWGTDGSAAIRVSATQDFAPPNNHGAMIEFMTRGNGEAFPATRMRIAQGVQLGAPTGADRGAGTLNSTGLFINGVAVSGVNPTVSWLAGANPAGGTLFVADRPMTILTAVGVVEVANGNAATVRIVKAAAGTPLSAGTPIHSGGTDFNANGTPGQNQPFSLTTTTMIAGERLGLQTPTGAFAASVASIHVTLA